MSINVVERFYLLFLIIVVFCGGVAIGVTIESKETYNRCVTSNPEVLVGEIESFCNDRLYLDKKNKQK